MPEGCAGRRPATASVVVDTFFLRNPENYQGRAWRVMFVEKAGVKTPSCKYEDVGS